MKNKIYNIGVGLIVLILSGCVDLDREIITSLTKEQVNSQYDFVLKQLTGLYSDLPNGYFEIGNGMQASACDEADYTYQGSVQAINSGSWNQYNNPDDVFGRYYTAIRKVNDFLSPAAEVNLEAFRLDPSSDSQLIYSQRSAEIKNWKNEARFLRAFYYFELVKRYGGVPLITKPLTLETDFSIIKRNSLIDCFNFIVSECDSVSAIGALPVKYSGAEIGRVTKGAALALKSRVLLYKASDLYNSPSQWASGYQHPELISVTGDRPTMWKEAADAAKAVINLSSQAGYSLTIDYTSIGKKFDNPEIIMARRNGTDNYFEQLNFPVGVDAIARGSVTPSQNLIDAYEMNNGTPFDWNNPAHSSDPYYNRDPRMGFTVFFNQSKFKTIFLDCTTGGKNADGGVTNGTKTGYYLRKLVDPTLDLDLNRTSVHSWPLFRISEMYLNYAEALNEYKPGDADILIYTNKTRQRKNVLMPAITETDQAKLRERIRNERRIELAFEGHRLWDVRRWMIAMDVLNQPLYGMSIVESNNILKYEKKEVEKRVFLPKMYFYPIPQSVLLTEGNDWPQNPLW